jgi:hypothetical protein
MFGGLGGSLTANVATTRGNMNLITQKKMSGITPHLLIDYSSVGSASAQSVPELSETISAPTKKEVMFGTELLGGLAKYLELEKAS